MCKECEEKTKEIEEPKLTVLETMMNRTSTLDVVEKIVEEVNQDNKPKFKTVWDQIVDKTVWMGLNTNISYWENKGYYIPRYKDKKGRLSVKRGTVIEVKTEDLSNGSNEKVKVICNNCREIHFVTFAELYNHCISQNKLYYCQPCSGGTKEKLEKLRMSHLGIKPSEETRKKLRLRFKGEKHPNWGGKYSKKGKDNHFWNPNLTDEERGKRRAITPWYLEMDKIS
jgi:hypothetical protein